MGAVLGAVLANPLTATRDFAEHALAAASPCIPPWSATGRVRANAAAFAVRRVHGQVHYGAGGDPQAAAECNRLTENCHTPG